MSKRIRSRTDGLDRQRSRASNRVFVFMGLQRLHHAQAVADDWQECQDVGGDLDQWRGRIASGAVSLGYPRQQLEADLRWQIQLVANAALVARQDDKHLSSPGDCFMLKAAHAECCRPHVTLDGFIAPIDDPVWQRLTPPLSYGCRCARVVWHGSAADDGVLTTAHVPTAEPARGFDFYPDESIDLSLAVEWMQAQCDPLFDHPFSHEWPYPRHEPTSLPMMFWLAPPAPDQRDGVPYQQPIDAIFDRLWAVLHGYEPLPIKHLLEAVAVADKDDLTRRLGDLAARTDVYSPARAAAVAALTRAFVEAIRLGIKHGRDVFGKDS